MVGVRGGGTAAAVALLAALALSATVQAVLEEEPKWDQMQPEGLTFQSGASPAGVGMAIDPGHLALRVESSSQGGMPGMVDLYRKNPDVLALQESGLQGTGPRNASWVFIQRLEPPREAASAFGEAMCIGGSRIAVSFEHAIIGNDGPRSPVTGVALYKQDQTGSPWSFQTVLLGDPATGASVGGQGRMSMTELGDMLVLAKQEPIAGRRHSRRRLNQEGSSSSISTSVVIYTLRGGEWTLESSIPIPKSTQVAGVAVSPTGLWIGVSGTTVPDGQATVQMFKRRLVPNQDSNNDSPWWQMATLNIESNFTVSSLGSIAISGGLMAVGAGSVITAFAVDDRSNWVQEDVLRFPEMSATGFTMGLGDTLLVVGTAAAVSVHMRLPPSAMAGWPEAFELQLSAAMASGSPPAQVVQAGLEIAIAAKPSPNRGVSVTYLDASVAFPDANATDSGKNPVFLLLRMTGITAADLTLNRTEFLQQGIANISFANENLAPFVSLRYMEYWESVFAQVNLTIPEGYNREASSFDLFNGVRFGDLNRILVGKDLFFSKVQFDATGLGGFNPFLLPPEPTPEPEPTFPPSPLIMMIETNSTRESNQFIITAKESNDANPPERTNTSVISYAAIGGGALAGLAIFILCCRQVVMSVLLRRDVQAETVWKYDPYESSKPKFSGLVRARMAVARMEEEEAYLKYYGVEADAGAAGGKNFGQVAAQAMNEFLKAKPPTESKSEALVKMQEQTTNVKLAVKGVLAFQGAGSLRNPSNNANSAAVSDNDDVDGDASGGDYDDEDYDDGLTTSMQDFKVSAASLDLDFDE